MTPDLTRWALSVEPPSSRACGAHLVGRVLVALVQYANEDGVAWPSTRTLEDDLGGIGRRDVRNALDALVAGGVIEVVSRGSGRRSTRYRVHAPVDNSSNGRDTPSNTETGNGRANGRGNGRGIGRDTPPRIEEKRTTPLPPTPTDTPPANGRGEFPTHIYETNARAALTRVHRECQLPIDPDELLDIAYRAGSGDPWAGYLAMKDDLVRSLEGSRDPARVLRSRLQLIRKDQTA
jgi:hypothetical protein